MTDSTTAAPGNTWSTAWEADPNAAEAIADEVASLGWSYVARLSHYHRPIDLVDHLAKLGGRDFAFLLRLRFVVSKEAEDLIRAAPRLLPRLPQSTAAVKEIAREVRGRIDWPGTVKERLARGGDPTLFLIARASRHANVPENRVLVFLLDRLIEMARAVATGAGGKSVIGREPAAAIGTAATRLRSVSALAAIPSLSVISGMERQAVRASRLPEFRQEVAALLALYDGLFGEATDLATLRRLLRERVWLPPEPERLFELWVLFAAVQSLEGAGWRLTAMRLLGSGVSTGPAFELARDQTNLAIQYQSLPRELLASSRYTPLLEAYGIEGSARRPDLVVTLESVRGQTMRALVEVKLTERRDYLVDSIYKVLGYLSDFSAALGTAPPTHAALVVWGGIKAVRVPSPDHEMLILDVKAVRGGAFVSFVDKLLDPTSTPPMAH